MGHDSTAHREGTSGTQGKGEVDWRAIEGSPEFRELIRRKRRFLVPASVFFLAFFGVYLALATFAPGFMGTQIVDGLPVGWLLAMSQVFMTWGVTWAYLRQADRVFEPLEHRAAGRAAGETDGRVTGSVR